MEFSNSMEDFSLFQGGRSHTGKTRESWEKQGGETEERYVLKTQEMEYC